MRNRKGYSLVEVMVAVGILAVMGLGLASLSFNFATTNNEQNVRTEANEFTRAFFEWLLSTRGCSLTFVGRPLPSFVAQEALVVSNYSPIGSTLSPVDQVRDNEQITPTLRVNTLRVQSKRNPTPPTEERYGAQQLFRNYVMVNLDLEIRLTGKIIKSKEIEIPVLTDNRNIIRQCGTELTDEQACMAIGAVFNPATGRCTVANNCQIQGTYGQPVSNPPAYCCYVPPGIPYLNQITGTASCPAGATAQYIGQKLTAGHRKYSCGKKCKAPIYDFLNYYVCLKCN